jgi:hypothetical protein
MTAHLKSSQTSIGGVYRAHPQRIIYPVLAEDEAIDPLAEAKRRDLLHIGFFLAAVVVEQCSRSFAPSGADDWPLRVREGSVHIYHRVQRSGMIAALMRVCLSCARGAAFALLLLTVEVKLPILLRLIPVDSTSEVNALGLISHLFSCSTEIEPFLAELCPRFFSFSFCFW